MKRVPLILLTCLSSTLLFAQSETYHRLVAFADSLYQAKNYKASASFYSDAFRSNDWKAYPNDRYNAACCFALAGEIDSAFYHLQYLERKSDYKNYAHISTDQDLIPLYKDARWKSLLELIKENKTIAEKDLDHALVAQLDSIYMEDQQYRRQLGSLEEKYGRNSPEMRAHWALINEKDSLNLIAIKAILDNRGWLGPEVVGETGNSCLFLVIQHSDQATQEKYLPMMREAVKNGKASGSSLALLEDRVALGQGKKQLYGSQIGREENGNYYVLPLQDPDHVDELRKSVGLSTLNEYTHHWDFSFDVESYKKDLPRLEALSKK